MFSYFPHVYNVFLNQHMVIAPILNPSPNPRTYIRTSELPAPTPTPFPCMHSKSTGRVRMVQMKSWVGIGGGKVRRNVLCVGISVRI